MARVTTIGAVLFMVGISTAHAQSKADEAAVRNLPNVFAAAFNNHDGHELAQLVTDDTDFVTVGATWLHGKLDFEKYHTRLLNGRFHAIRIQVLQVAARFIRPEIAIVHWSWTATGDKNPDRTARTRRYGMMTMVAEKQSGHWLVIASQNDDSFPGLPPEFEGISSPMPIPDQVGPQPSDP